MLRLLPFALLLAVAGCNKSAPPPVGPSKLKVVATFSVIGEFAQTVGGDNIELVTLVGPDGDAHTFEPTPQDAAKLANADLILENGLGFEGHWLDKAYSAAGSKAKRHVVAKGVAPITLGDEPDPHVWHSPDNAVKMVAEVAAALGGADPGNLAVYGKRAAEASTAIVRLKAWVQTEVDKLPKDRRKLVTSHDTFGYFARDFGFTVAGTVLPTSTAAEDPSAADFARLVEKVKAEKVPAVFCEASHNAKLIERLAKEAGVVVGPTLFTDALGKPGSGGDTYDAMMRHNVTAIVTSLSK